MPRGRGRGMSEASGSEAYAIYAAAFDRYAVSRKTLLRYAGRRNRTETVNTILKEIEK